MIGILVDAETGDLLVRDGALVLGEASHQVIEHALVAARGEYREQPQIGAEVAKRAHGIASRMWCARANWFVGRAVLRYRRSASTEIR